MEIRNSVGFLFEPFKNLKIDVRLLREKNSLGQIHVRRSTLEK